MAIAFDHDTEELEDCVPRILVFDGVGTLEQFVAAACDESVRVKQKLVIIMWINARNSHNGQCLVIFCTVHILTITIMQVSKEICQI